VNKKAVVIGAGVGGLASALFRGGSVVVTNSVQP